MTTEHQSSRYPLWLRKLVIPALIGGVAGFATYYVFLKLIGRDVVEGLTVSNNLAALVGVLYLVIALGTLIGTLTPKAGVRFLNVEDADELREQKSMLVHSGGAMALFGVALIALALAAPDGPVPQNMALIVGAGGLLTGTVLSVLVYRYCDELMLAVNLEAGAISYGLVFAIVGLWAMLAHLDYVAAPQPLDLLTLFYVLVLVATFIAAGRRGMLKIK